MRAMTTSEAILYANSYTQASTLLGEQAFSKHCGEIKLGIAESLLDDYESILVLESLDSASIAIDLIWLITSFVSVSRLVAYLAMGVGALLSSQLYKITYAHCGKQRDNENLAFLNEFKFLRLQQGILKQQGSVDLTSLPIPLTHQDLEDRWNNCAKIRRKVLKQAMFSSLILTGFFSFTYLWAMPDLLALVGFTGVASVISGPIGLAIIGVSSAFLFVASTYKLYQQKKLGWFRESVLEHERLRKNILIFTLQEQTLTEALSETGVVSPAALGGRAGLKVA